MRHPLEYQKVQVKDNEPASVRDKKLQTAAAAVCSLYDISVDQLREKTRKREIVMARALFYVVCNKYFSKTMGTHSIAAFVGKDHATVLHGEKVVRDYWDTDKEYRKMVGLFLEDFEIRVLPHLIYNYRSPKDLEIRKLRMEISALSAKCNRMYYMALKTIIDSGLEDSVKRVDNLQKLKLTPALELYE